MKTTLTRYTAILMTLALLCALLPCPASADSEGWYIVRSSEPNGYCYLYSKPTSLDGQSVNLGRYDNGELIYVLEYNQDNTNYCYVQTLDGKYGYIRAACLVRYTGGAAVSDQEGWYVVRSSEPKGYCYLYSKPTSQDGVSANLGRYDNGESVYVLEYNKDNTGYCYVQTEDGKYGFIRATCLSAPQPDKLRNLPELTSQCRGTVKNGSVNVYTGPASSYYRTASGSAVVSGGATVSVYGREGSYYLIQYTGKSGGKSVARFSFIPADRLTPRSTVSTLTYGWVPISIATGAHLADAPTTSHGYTSLSIDRDNAFALAQITDASGVVWVYFESLGYASGQGYVNVRGFVPMEDVSLR